MLPEYFIKFFIPQKANVNSKISPHKKKIEGIPSNTKLKILPNAKPPIKKIFVKVAANQNFGFAIPNVQIAAIPKYKPIVALKIFVKLMVSTLMSNNPNKIVFGDNP